MAAYAMAPFVTRTSTNMVSTIQDKRVSVYHQDGFQGPLYLTYVNLNPSMDK